MAARQQIGEPKRGGFGFELVLVAPLGAILLLLYAAYALAAYLLYGLVF